MPLFVQALGHALRAMLGFDKDNDRTLALIKFAAQKVIFVASRESLDLMLDVLGNGIFCRHGNSRGIV